MFIILRNKWKKLQKNTGTLLGAMQYVQCSSLILDNSLLSQWSSVSDGESLSGDLLLGELDATLIGSGDVTGLLSNVELNMAVGGQVWGNSTVSSVSSSSSLNGSLGGDMSDLALLSIETLSLSVGLEVLEEVHNVFDRFLWESSIEEVDLFAHSFSWDTIVESSEWNDRLVGEDLLHVLDSLVQVHASGGSGSLVAVLEMCSQVINSAFSS